MKLVSCKCPNCGSTVKLNENLERCTCNYCGAEVINEHVHRLNVSGEIIFSNVNVKKETKPVPYMFVGFVVGVLVSIIFFEYYWAGVNGGIGIMLELLLQIS